MDRWIEGEVKKRKEKREKKDGAKNIWDPSLNMTHMIHWTDGK